MKESPETSVIISELITRTDKPENSKKVTEVNNKLLSYCKLNKWGHIKHDNIQSKHINPYGIHLNRAGTSLLAKNITTYLNDENN